MEEKPERIGEILKRIESLLLRIALQMDVELSDAENEVAALRKTGRHQCASHAAEIAENKGCQDKGRAEIVAPGAS